MPDAAPILVTGSTGFIGTALCAELRRRGFAFRHALRAANEGTEPAVIVGDIHSRTDWSAAVSGVRAVLHLAGRAHVYGRGAEHAARMFEVNAGATGALARAALHEGVERFVLLSTTKVLGDVSPPGGYREEDPAAPADDYARSKEAGEREVKGVDGLPWTIVRTPLVYGAGVKANFRALMRAVDRGVPLPLGAITANRRSLIYVENLVDSLLHVLDAPQAVGETFLVSDEESVSTRDLAERIGVALQRPPRLVPVPVPLLRLAGLVTGKAAAVNRLIESAAVDAAKIKALTGWRVPFSMTEGLARTAAWYRGH